MVGGQLLGHHESPGEIRRGCSNHLSADCAPDSTVLIGCRQLRRGQQRIDIAQGPAGHQRHGATQPGLQPHQDRRQRIRHGHRVRPGRDVGQGTVEIEEQGVPAFFQSG